MKRKIPLEEARQLMLDLIFPLGAEKIAVSQAGGRILAQDFLSPLDFPPAPAAALDGYALHQEDLAKQAVLECQEILAPAELPQLILSAGKTCRVCTGNPVPEGTAAVLGWEQIEADGNKIKIKASLKAGDNLKPAGEDFQKGQRALAAGQKLGAAELAVLNLLQAEEVEAVRRPRISLFCLSPEVVPNSPAPGQIADSNGTFLAEDLSRQGAVIVDRYYLSQEQENLPACLAKVASRSDLILTVGGAAGGATDTAWEFLRQGGVQMQFWEVQAKPGSHCGGGFLEQIPVLSLSGNPGACFVIYQLLVKPIFRALQRQESALFIAKLPLNQNYPRSGGPRRFLRGHLRPDLTVDLLPGQKSSMLHSLVGCDALIELAAGHAPVAAGEAVKVYLLN